MSKAIAQPPYFVYPIDLLKVYKGQITHPNSTYHKYKSIKEVLGKKAHENITRKELADWLDIPLSDLHDILE